MNISSAIIHAHPGDVAVVRAGLATLAGVEVHGISSEGKMIVTIETEDDGSNVATVSYTHLKMWLARYGDPYVFSAVDADGRVGIDYGVYGVPETYVIDKAGVIRMKHTGPITPDILGTKIMPLLAELSK